MSAVDRVRAFKRLRASDVVTPLEEFALHLQNASRVHLDSPSNRALRTMLRSPRLLDELERVVKAEIAGHGRG